MFGQAWVVSLRSREELRGPERERAAGVEAKVRGNKSKEKRQKEGWRETEGQIHSRTQEGRKWTGEEGRDGEKRER